jgi:hypothetical protein
MVLFRRVKIRVAKLRAVGIDDGFAGCARDFEILVEPPPLSVEIKRLAAPSRFEVISDDKNDVFRLERGSFKKTFRAL